MLLQSSNYDCFSTQISAVCSRGTGLALGVARGAAVNCTGGPGQVQVSHFRTLFPCILHSDGCGETSKVKYVLLSSQTSQLFEFGSRLLLLVTVRTKIRGALNGRSDNANGKWLCAARPFTI